MIFAKERKLKGIETDRMIKYRMKVIKAINRKWKNDKD